MLDRSRYHVNMIDLNKRDLETPPIERLYQAYRACTSKPDAILASLGLGRAHHRVLYFLGRHPGITVKALLEKLRVSKQAAHGPLRELVKRGLVAVVLSAQDRRVRLLTLTAAGNELEQQLTSPQVRHLERAFEIAGPAATAGWIEVLEAIAALD